MKTLLILILICVSFSVSAQIYIDPDYIGTESGTFAQPWSKIPAITSNNTYLFKRGTQLDTTTCNFAATNITWGAYGIGARPIIIGNISNAHQFQFNSNTVTIRDIEFIGKDSSTFSVLKVSGSTSAHLANLVLSRGIKGLEISGYVNARMDSMNIQTVSNDGIYSSSNDTVRYNYLNIFDINTGWASDIGGDCIQNESNDYIYVRNCYLDHTVPGKFPLICNNYISTYVDNSKLLSSGTGIYIGGGTTFTIDSSYIGGGWDGQAITGMWDHVGTLNMTHSIVKDVSDIGIKDGIIRNISNCTFVNVSFVLSGYNTGQVTFNNNIMHHYGRSIGAVNVSADGNNYYLNSLNNITKYSSGTNKTYLNPVFQDSVLFHPTESLLSGKGANLNSFTFAPTVLRTILPSDDRTIANPCNPIIEENAILTQSLADAAAALLNCNGNCPANTIYPNLSPLKTRFIQKRTILFNIEN